MKKLSYGFGIILYLVMPNAFADNISGHYKITVMCASGNGYGELEVTGRGKTYSITGRSRGGTYNGQIRNGQVHMTFVGSGNEAAFSGKLTTPSEFSGTLTQRASFGGACSWNAIRNPVNLDTPAKDNPKACAAVDQAISEMNRLLRSDRKDSDWRGSVEYTCSRNYHKIRTIGTSIKGAGCQSKMRSVDKILQKIGPKECWISDIPSNGVRG
jgi:hypothetical protein